MSLNLNQELQNKYPHLEISVLDYSDAMKDNDSKRIDSEFFKKEYLENEKISELFTETIGSICDKNIKNIKSLNLNKNFNYLQISDIDISNGLVYSTIETNFNEIPDRATYILQNNDICVSTVRPNRNAVSLIYNAKRIIGTSGFCVLRPNKDKILPSFLYIFCKTKFFISAMMRANSASLYPAVSNFDIYKCKIPLFPIEFQQEIEALVKRSHECLEQSKDLYRQAEVLLYEELGLNPHNPLDFIEQKSSGSPKTDMRHSDLYRHSERSEESLSFKENQDSSPTAQNDEAVTAHNDKNLAMATKYAHLNISVRPLSQSLNTTGRLDSEYYQQKYDEIERVIKKQKFAKLSDLVDMQKSIEPGSEAYQENGIPFIRVSNFNKFGISDTDIFLDFAEFSQTIKPKMETILLSKDGSIGTAYCVKNDGDFITSSALLHLNIKNEKQREILPEYLTLILNSILVKLQSERDSGGSIIAHWRISEIEQILIPILDISIQEKIENLIKQSFTLRKKASELLQTAKSKVETAIEKG